MRLAPLLVAICERISPRAITWIDAAPVLMRSRCFTGVAANLRDPAWCARVQSVRTLLSNGARFSRERCLERVAHPRGTLAGGIDDPAPCTSFYEIDTTELRPVARAGRPEPDRPVWYRTKLRSGELQRHLERLPELSYS